MNATFLASAAPQRQESLAIPVFLSSSVPPWYTRTSYLVARDALLQVNSGLTDSTAPDGDCGGGPAGPGERPPARLVGGRRGAGAEGREQQREEDPPEQ